MTPLEKAIELRDKYFDIIFDETRSNNLHVKYALAEKLAITDIDEQINLIQSVYGYHEYTNELLYEKMNFLEEVKKELNEL